jgi:hypothetical protein
LVFLEIFSTFAAAMQKRARHIFAALQLLVIFFWLGGTTLFVHSHNIDGKGIVHSHPYDGDADEHGHSADNILQIQRLANLDILNSESSAYNSNLTSKHIDEAVYVVEHIRAIDHLSTSLRAPPVMA